MNDYSNKLRLVGLAGSPPTGRSTPTHRSPGSASMPESWPGHSIEYLHRAAMCSHPQFSGSFSLLRPPRRAVSVRPTAAGSTPRPLSSYTRLTGASAAGVRSRSELFWFRFGRASTPTAGIWVADLQSPALRSPFVDPDTMHLRIAFEAQSVDRSRRQHWDGTTTQGCVWSSRTSLRRLALVAAMAALAHTSQPSPGQIHQGESGSGPASGATVTPRDFSDTVRHEGTTCGRKSELGPSYNGDGARTRERSHLRTPAPMLVDGEIEPGQRPGSTRSAANSGARRPRGTSRCSGSKPS